MGDPEVKKKSFEALVSAAGFIAVHASKKVVLRHFPELHFQLDDSVAKQMRIDTLLRQIEHERDGRDSLNRQA
jgi:ribosome-binding factor A